MNVQVEYFGAGLTKNPGGSIQEKRNKGALRPKEVPNKTSGTIS